MNFINSSSSEKDMETIHQDQVISVVVHTERKKISTSRANRNILEKETI